VNTVRADIGLANSAMRAQYQEIARRIGDSSPISVLHIGEDHSAVALGTPAQPPAIVMLAVGSSKTAREHFKYFSPTALELENAIATVEDELTRVRTMVQVGSALFTTDAAVHEIARIGGHPDHREITLTLDAVERTFERLVAVTQGRRHASAGLPNGLEFAATLLILREFMHHLQFSAITVVG
jgi:exopolyphosphatase/pppGpp-phosphohydrolase